MASCGEEKTVKVESKEAKETRVRAEAGDAHAQVHLGFIYFTGEGVPKDDDEALKWYRKAAEQGNSDALHNLGAMYVNGSGVQQDDAKAYMFFNLAAAKGDEDAEELKKDIKKRMTKRQIAEAQKLTREWLERKAKENGE